MVHNFSDRRVPVSLWIMGIIILTQSFVLKAQIVISDTTFLACDSLPFEMGIPAEPGFSYSWFPISGLSTPDSNYTSAILENYNPSEALLVHYSLYTSDSTGQIIAERRHHIYVLSFSEYFINLGIFPICKGDTLRFDPFAGIIGNLIIEPEEFGSQDGEGQIMLYPNDTTDFIFTSIDSFNCGRIIYNLRVDVREFEEARIITPDTRLCSGNSGETLMIQVEPTGGILMGSGIMSGNIFSSDIAGNGIHRIVYYSSQNSCLSTDTILIEVLGPSSVSLSGPPNLCQTDSVILLDYGFPANGSYFIDGILSETLNASILTAGSHEMLYRYAWDSICSFDREKTFYIIPLPVNPVINSSHANYMACIGDSIELSTSFFPNFGWSNGFMDQTQVFKESKDSLFVWFRSNTGCYSYSDTIDIMISSPGTINLSTSLYPNGFEISSNGSSDGGIYWEFDGGQPPFSVSVMPNTGFIKNGSLTLLHSGPYNLTFLDAAGCIVTDSVFLYEPDYEPINTPSNLEFSLPNAFTPNGDGFNDTYKINKLFPDYVQNKFMVWDIARRLVFSAENYHNTWDGLDSSGKKLPAGTYFAVFECSKLDGPVKAFVDLRYE